MPSDLAHHFSNAPQGRGHAVGRRKGNNAVVDQDSTWIVMKDDLHANEVGGHLIAKLIPKDARLTLVRGWIPPHPPGNDSPPQVRFHYGGLDYWTFEVNFLEACKPEPAAEDGMADPFATLELRKVAVARAKGQGTMETLALRCGLGRHGEKHLYKWIRDRGEGNHAWVKTPGKNKSEKASGIEELLKEAERARSGT